MSAEAATDFMASVDLGSERISPALLATSGVVSLPLLILILITVSSFLLNLLGGD